MLRSLRTKLYRRFHEPQDVYSAIYPLFYFCTLFGLAPYSLNRLESGKKEFKFAWWPVVRNGILVAWLVGNVGYNAIFQRSPFKDSEMREKLRYFQEIFSSLLSCCAIIFGCIFALKIVEVFKNIDEVDVAFRSLAVWVPYKGLYVKILVHVVALVGLIFLIVLDFIFLTSFLPTSNTSVIYSTYMTFVTILLPYFINLLMELQYCHYLNILRIRYKLLNEYLETLVDENKSYNGWVDEDVATICEDNKAVKKEKMSGKLPKSMMAISDPVFIVDQAAALHIKLTDTAHMINYAFCAQQLIRITVAFISIVTALFLIASNFSKANTAQTSGLDVFFTAWAMSNALEVMGIVWITSETCEEANACPRILHKIRNNTTNAELQDTIEIYSLQMYHNRLYFTVCGLFPLDYTLLYTIVAGVTTYLVILIQFNNADFVKKNATTLVNNATV